ncbi:hypothetical protein EVAR_62580_1 [Eumeta japonica]|uniref:Uncharacterized protein n=1 Tax=Eumeta variegata TaxID=151549 RepID=A0A4C1YB44_EUMVA|nr:hypothetical protein EVAR_62580_1 [Eumeta japonica]
MGRIDQIIIIYEWKLKHGVTRLLSRGGRDSAPRRPPRKSVALPPGALSPADGLFIPVNDIAYTKRGGFRNSLIAASRFGYRQHRHAIKIWQGLAEPGLNAECAIVARVDAGKRLAAKSRRAANRVAGAGSGRACRMSGLSFISNLTPDLGCGVAVDFKIGFTFVFKPAATTNRYKEIEAPKTRFSGIPRRSLARQGASDVLWLPKRVRHTPPTTRSEELKLPARRPDEFMQKRLSPQSGHNGGARRPHKECKVSHAVNSTGLPGRCFAIDLYS